MPICSKCGEDKSLDLFSKGKNSKGGHRARCKFCDAIYYRNWQQTCTEKLNKRKRAWQLTNPKKAMAVRMISHAIRDGKLVRGTCEVCGTDINVHGHHDDYEKPLEVRWLCAKHHHALHREMSEMEETSEEAD